jgi:hypothetical protein
MLHGVWSHCYWQKDQKETGTAPIRRAMTVSTHATVTTCGSSQQLPPGFTALQIDVHNIAKAKNAQKFPFVQYNPLYSKHPAV